MMSMAMVSRQLGRWWRARRAGVGSEVSDRAGESVSPGLSHHAVDRLTHGARLVGRAEEWEDKR